VSVLSDRDIQRAITLGHLVVKPDPDLTQLQPATIDLRLGAVATMVGGGLTPNAFGEYSIGPKQFLLGSTMETVSLGPSILGTVHGKSTRARQGLLVEAAGLVDPGFSGQLTLELFNMSNGTIFLKPGITICQISFQWLSSTCDRPYGTAELGSHYQHQRGPTKASL
jgi:dCTP deaminase